MDNRKYMESKLPIILDIEASGFGQGSYPIEVGFVLPSKKRLNYLVKPEAHWTHWSSSAERQHHIKRELLFHMGVNVRQVADELNKTLAGELVYTDAWGHDLSWLGKLYDAAGRLPNFKLEPIRAILTQAQIEIWHRVKENLVEFYKEPRHRASSDAAIIQLCYEFTQVETGFKPYQ